MSALSPFMRGLEGGRLAFWCPACREAHTIAVGPGGWQWNGDAERPVFSPSVKVSGHKVLRGPDGKWNGGWELDPAGNPIASVCHSFVGCNGALPGQIVFLGDCTHELAGRIVDLVPWPSRSDGA